MKKLFLMLSLICSTGTALMAQANTWQNENGEFVETTKPIFLFEEESYDFGKMEEDAKYTHDFKFKNIGSEPLIITNVKASCGCTTPKWPKEPIMPGESSSINVVFNSKGKSGVVNKAVTITSNAVEPVKRVFVKGDIQKGTPAVEKDAKPIMEEGGSEE